jgi:N-acetylglucosamine kinase-like BadF-type ATPase
MENFEVLKSLILSIEGDVNKFAEKGNKAAGSRVRKAMQEVKTLAQAIRVDVQESKKAPSAE